MSHTIQLHLHLVSDEQTLNLLNADELRGLQTLRHQGLPVIAPVLAVLWTAIGGGCILLAVTGLLGQWRVLTNALHFLGRIGFIVFAGYWIVGLTLSSVNGLLSLTNSTVRAPFPQPSLPTAVSFAWAIGYAIIQPLLRKMRPPALTPEYPSGPMA